MFSIRSHFKRIGLKLRAWGELLRIPNLLSAPGDVLAGFFLAGGLNPGQVLMPTCIGVLLYAAGLVMNDIADMAVDARERPTRPLPSGRLSLRSSLAGLWVLLTAAWLLALLAGAPVLMISAMITLSITAYNFRGKHHPLLGPVLMGGCRGLNVTLGWAGAGGLHMAPLAAALCMAVFIAAISSLARRETASTRYGLERFVPMLLVGSMFALILIFVPDAATRAGWAGSLVFAAALCFYGARKLNINAPEGIGFMLRSILPIQAAGLAAANAPDMAMLLLALLLPQTLLARRFHAS